MSLNLDPVDNADGERVFRQDIQSMVFILFNKSVFGFSWFIYFIINDNTLE